MDWQSNSIIENLAAEIIYTEHLSLLVSFVQT
jgi:hypothetical protein